jgi:hypothetical protein
VKDELNELDRGDGDLIEVLSWGLPGGFEDNHGKLQTESPESQARFLLRSVNTSAI